MFCLLSKILFCASRLGYGARQIALYFEFQFTRDINMAGHLHAYKIDFLQRCIDAGVLKFGTFELKSKRISPYFFNAGLFYRADLLRSISMAYAETLRDYLFSHPLNFDVL